MKQVFAFLDKKAEAMLDPWSSLNAATAIRETEIRMRQDQNLREFCADFTLMLVGQWDPENGLEALPPTAVIELKSLASE